MSRARRYLLDVNVLIAVLDKDHIHHRAARGWFDMPGLEWVLCPFTEAGFLRITTNPKTGFLNLQQATAMLARLAGEPGYHYETIPADWRTLTRPFAKYIFGHNQVTDAWLLGMALHAGLMLMTFDRAILHLAGVHHGSALLLEG